MSAATTTDPDALVQAYVAHPGDRKRFKVWALAHGVNPDWDDDGAAVHIEAYYVDQDAKIDAWNVVNDKANAAADAAYNAVIAASGIVKP